MQMREITHWLADDHGSGRTPIHYLQGGDDDLIAFAALVNAKINQLKGEGSS
jgi:hypothetical protein